MRQHLQISTFVLAVGNSSKVQPEQEINLNLNILYKSFKKKIMGNNHSQKDAFNKEEWDLVERTDRNCLWRSRRDPTLHIQQYDIYSKDSQQYEQEKESFQFRSQYPQLVTAVFFKEQQQQQFCSTNHQSSLFIEKIPIRLADVEHIPFPDCLHLYFQTLFGFQIIAGKYGHFEVQQEHIGINEKGVVKVWLNRDFSKSYINGGKITEEQMVKGTIDILDKNCDPNISGNIPTIRNFLYRNADSLNFEQATAQLRSYCISYNQGFVPEKLDCIDRVGGIYAIANRLSTQGQNLGTGRYSQDSARIIQPSFQRPRISSEHQLQSDQRIPYPQEQVGQYYLKASEALLPNSSREPLIINPNAYRENMDIIRRKRQEQSNYLVTNSQANPLRYSQIESRAKIGTVQSPIKASQAPQVIHGNPSEIRFIIPQQKMVAVQGPNQSVSFNPSQQILQQGRSIEPTSQQFTFKSFNQNPVDNQPHVDNTSFANFSLGPSQSSTQRDRNSLTSQQYTPPINYPSNITIQSAQRELTIPNGTLPSQASGKLQQNRVINQPDRAQLSQTQQISNLQPLLEVSKSGNSQQRPPLSQPNVLIKEQVPQAKYNHNRPLRPSNFSQEVFYTQSVNSGLNSDQIGKTYDISGPIASKNVSQPTISQSRTKNYPISADDGKSSEEFMRKLRQMTQGISPSSQVKTQTNQIPTYSQNNAYEANFSSDYNAFQPKYSYQPKAQTQNFSSEDEEFGRNAVSNIIQTQQGFTKQYSGFSTEPLKFENNLTMKYSRLEADEPSPQKRLNAGFYEPEMDADLLADLRKIKQ